MKEPHWAFVDEDGIVHLTRVTTSQRRIGPSDFEWEKYVYVACSARFLFSEAEAAKELFIKQRTRWCRRNKPITCLACLAGETP